jgi:hypothetical protein
MDAVRCEYPCVVRLIDACILWEWAALQAKFPTALGMEVRACE